MHALDRLTRVTRSRCDRPVFREVCECQHGYILKVACEVDAYTITQLVG